jgi:uncharacterized damage-inducible protein DinB
MTLDSLLKDYVAYNFWANERIIHWLKTKPSDKITLYVASSFPSLRATLLHIWAAEDIWLHRLQQISPTEFLSNTFQGTDEELFERLLQNSESFKNFIHRQSADFFDLTIAYKHTTGKLYEQYSAEIIQHCMQHSTFHRGQIITMARNLEITDPPKTDYIEYVRLKHSNLL